MNEIDILEEHIKNLNSFNELSRINKQMTICFNANGEGIKRIIQAISNLISENKELKEKNKELEKSLKFQKKLTKIAQIITDESLKEALEEIEKDYIPKSKVEEKIKELKDDMLSSRNLDEFHKNQYAYTVLRHLIYEENKND